MKTRSISRVLSLALLLSVVAASCKKDLRVEKEQVLAGNSSKAAASVYAIAPVETPQTVAIDTFVIVNRKSGKMLHVVGAGTSNGTNVAQNGGTGETYQFWALTATSGGYYKIIGVHSGKALDAAGTADSANVQIYSYWGGNNQQWTFVSLPGGFYRIENRASGKVLEVSGSSSSNLANVHQMAWNGGENQQWALVPTAYNGQLTWQWTSTANVPADALTRITAAMNDACARYNRGANWTARTITVEYNTGLATADAVVSGHIRFGANSAYQKVRTAMHELGHCYGVGQTSAWASLSSGGQYS